MDFFCNAVEMIRIVTNLVHRSLLANRCLIKMEESYFMIASDLASILQECRIPEQLLALTNKLQMDAGLSKSMLPTALPLELYRGFLTPSIVFLRLIWLVEE
ncbi:hypothetical protein Cni_G13763 [Canna indica]|uniref:Uncharacterized protein n=1 Tax=Canna indica TaxID=4628 RepID=A0AAQ3QE18_9LILI|nr:hypothetical protein Cni_G13763 [Canna indica]